MNSFLRSATASILAIVFSYVTLMTGCMYEPVASAATQEAAGAQVAPAAAPAEQMSVDELVAPVALYPDQLLAQVLTASTNPQEVLDGGNWLIQNESLKGDALADAAKAAEFSPSMQYLMAFPQVVDNMCQEIDWTTQLGAAFKADQKSVMEAVQRKRVEAQNAGNLKTSPEMVVATQKADNGQQYVEIQPANPQVIYVPQYNPVTIYTTPAPTTVIVQAPTTQVSSGVSTGSAVAIGLISFGVGMAIGAAWHRDNYYPYPSWGYHGVWWGGHPYYPPPYRPRYPGYRPAYGYHPPPNYHWNQYNRNVNVTVNNNYYNRYNKTTVNNRNTNVNNVNRNGGTQNNWKGQSTYQGARPTTNGGKPGASMTTANPQNKPPTTRSSNVNGNMPTSKPTNTANKPSTYNRPANGNGASQGNANRPTNGNTNNMSKPSARPATTTAPRPATTTTPRPAPQQGNKNDKTSNNNKTSSANGSNKQKGNGSDRAQGGQGNKKASQ
jgi:hypothetical protein